MADVSITAASVVPGADAIIGTGTAGVAITAGQSIYLDVATSTWKLAIATSAAAAGSGGVTIALSNAAANQPVNYLVSGSVTIGGTVVKAGVYVVSANAAGAIAPIADLGSGNYLSILGYASTTAILTLFKSATGVTK